MQEHWKQTPYILRSWAKAFGSSKLKHLQALCSPPLFHTQAHIFLHAPISTKLGSPAPCYCREAPRNAGDANSAWQPRVGSLLGQRKAAPLQSFVTRCSLSWGTQVAGWQAAGSLFLAGAGRSTKKIAGELARVAQATAKQRDEKCRVAQQQQGESPCHTEPGSQHTLATQKSPQ